ncbi:DHA2 family efflux MFS transporter permease subunit [Modicisalibacter tunisiensis]|uniref:DHA2 family efflux MFS transporter permease subunit n=1 Tax=Modicisalibacter tunisiensis TaxID=390637 RepID=UPI001CCAF57E|nr:DHA2 family efflux MFS transporter permease subunit [Modicisalibacter tunisiensis]MBZ9539374.1 DHA2 family efflux MFS transporter permease subunit [Modicisalibacter tunisiensis]
MSDAAADGARQGVSDLPPWPQRFGFIAAVFGMFMAILDIQIVASSLNEIQAGLSASQDEISWVQTAYLIAEIVMIPLSGMLMRILSTRVAFTLSCAGFTLASLGCALAGSIEQLIVLRAIQGFAGGAMIPITQAVSFSIFPRRVMGSVQAVIGMVVTMAPSVGPTVGGYLTDIASWHWLFLANVIPGVLVCWAAWTFLDIDKADHAVARRLDWLGLALIAVFLGSLEFVLEEGPGDDWFASDRIVVMTLLCVLAGIWFFARTLRREHPIVDLYAFANRNFALGAGLGFIIGIALYGLVYLMPLFFGHVRHFSSLQIGQVMFVTGLTMFFCAPIVGQLSNRVDLRLLLLAGLLLVGIGSMMNADLTVESGFWQFFWPQVVRGMGLILCIIPASRIALGTLPPHEVGNASGLFNVMRNLGGAVGLALLDTVRDWREDFHWNALAPAIDTGREVVVAEIAKYEAMLAGSVPDAHRAAVGMLVQRLSEQTVVMAFNDIFLWLGMIYLLSVPLVFLLRRIEA